MAQYKIIKEKLDKKTEEYIYKKETKEKEIKKIDKIIEEKRNDLFKVNKKETISFKIEVAQIYTLLFLFLTLPLLGISKYISYDLYKAAISVANIAFVLCTSSAFISYYYVKFISKKLNIDFSDRIDSVNEIEEEIEKLEKTKINLKSDLKKINMRIDELIYLKDEYIIKMNELLTYIHNDDIKNINNLNEEITKTFVKILK